MAEELHSQAMTFGGALDQPWDVGDDKSPVIGELHDAQPRFQCCEWVIGDFRPGRRNAGDERRLPGVREANQANIRKQLEFQPESECLAGDARLVFCGRLV